MNWPFLKPGDIVEIVAPGHGVSREGLERSLDYLRSLGFNPRAPENLLGDDLLCANNDELRLEHLKCALLAEDSSIIWCLKGGYGTSRLLPALDRIKKPPRLKLLVGFSDITALHLFVEKNWGWPGLHAPLLWQASANKIGERSLRKLEDILSGKCSSISCGLIPANLAAEGEIQLDAPVTGGNLSLVQHSIGTGWQVDAAGKILLLEDTDEAPYRIDRMLTHLAQAGVFDKTAAILLGEFSGKKEDVEKTEAVLNRFASSLPCPAFRLPDVGHGKENLPIPLHYTAKIAKKSGNAELVFDLS